MEKFYKQARIIAWLVLAVMVVEHLIDFEPFRSLGMLFNEQPGLGVLSYNWMGGILGLTELALWTWFFVAWLKVHRESKNDKIAAIVAFIGLGLILINNIVYAGEFFTAGEGYASDTHFTVTVIRLFASYYPGSLLLAIAILMSVRKLPVKSMAHIFAVAYFAYILVRFLYVNTLHFIVFKQLKSDFAFWNGTLPTILVYILEIILFLYLLGSSKAPKVSEKEIAASEPEPAVVDKKKKTFFLKRWLVGLSNALDRWLFKATPDEGNAIGGLFWLLVVAGFVIGGVSMAISFIGDAGGSAGSGLNFFEKLTIIALAISFGPLAYYISEKVQGFDTAARRILRGTYIVVMCAIGLALGYALGMIVVAAVILIFFAWLLLNVILGGGSGSGKSTKRKDESGPQPPSDNYAKEGDVVYHDGAKWQHDGSWGDPWHRV